MSNKRVLIALRVAISLIFIGVLLQQYGSAATSAVQKLFSTTGIPFLILAVCFHLSDKLLRILNLKRLLNASGALVSYLKLVTITLVSTFFGFFVPGEWGPDLVRIFHLKKYFSSYADPVSSTLILNVASVCSAALLTIAGIAIAAYMELEMRSEIVRAILILAGVVIAASAIAVTHQPRKLLLKVLDLRVPSMLDRAWRFIRKVISGVGQQLSGRNLVITLILSATGITATVMRTYFLAEGSGLTVPLLYFFVLVPTTMLITAIPISFAGIGIREYLFIFFLGSVGVEEGDALAVGLMVSGLNVCVALLGGAIYLTTALGTAWNQKSDQGNSSDCD